MRKIKFLVVLISALGVLTLGSCKKDKVDLAPTITANVNGTATNFNRNTIAVTITADGSQVTTIQGETTNGITLSLVLSGPLTSGRVFNNKAASDDDKPLFLYSSDAFDSDFVNDDDSANNQPTVTLTSVTSDKIEGTFAGDMVDVIGLNGPSPNAKHTVLTNGKFSVKLTK